MFILGPRYEGKTTFVSGAPRSIVMDYEDGAWGVPDEVNRAVRIRIAGHDHQEKIRTLLRQEAGKPDRPFDRVIIDTADRFLMQESYWLASEQRKIYPDWKGDTIEEWGMKGAGVSILSTHVVRFLDELETWGYAWTVVCHVKETTVTVGKEEQTVTRPSIYPSVAGLISNNADVTAVVEANMIPTPKFRTVTMASGNTQQLSDGVENVMRVVFDASVKEVGFGAGTGKVRGVTTMRLHVVLPTIESGQVGWDTVCDAYRTETQRVKENGVVKSPTT